MKSWKDAVIRILAMPMVWASRLTAGRGNGRIRRAQPPVASTGSGAVWR